MFMSCELFYLISIDFIDFRRFQRISMDSRGFSCIFMDLGGSQAEATRSEEGVWAVSTDFHGLSWISIDFHGFSRIFEDFHGFRGEPS